MQVFDFKEGNSPLLISMPHAGTQLPETIQKCMTPTALKLADTDWHLDQLYEFAHSELNANLLCPLYSRYLIDLNRNPSGKALYQNQNNTELCPTTCFDLAPIYQDDKSPSAREIQSRLTDYWQPYHDHIEQTLREFKDKFGIAILFEAHSIRSEVPRFFEGTLPDLSVGTNESRSCCKSMTTTAMEKFSASDLYSSVLDKRFKGGYITRHYGQPENNIHAIQLEISQKTYMDEDFPFHYDQEKAASLQILLKQVLATLIEWGKHNGG